MAPGKLLARIAQQRPRACTGLDYTKRRATGRTGSSTRYITLSSRKEACEGLDWRHRWTGGLPRG